VIELRHAGCTIAGKPILHDLHGTLPPHLILMGQNGAGKSTLARMLCGLQPYEGSIICEGQELRDCSLAERARAISYIPSRLENFDTYLSVGEFVNLGRYPHRNRWFSFAAEATEPLNATLAAFGLASLCTQRLDTLSSGEQQRAMMAQASLQNSAMIIFDEPTAHLDPCHTAAFVQHYRQIRSSHHTLLITHDLSLARHLGDAIAFIHEGRLHLFDTPAAFFTCNQLKTFYGVDFEIGTSHVGVRLA